MNRIYWKVLCFLGLFFASVLLAYDWPIKKFKDEQLIKAFGEVQDNKFFTGVAISGGGTAVYPIGTGEIIYYHDPESAPYPQMLGPGKVLVIQHGKLRSFYAHLKSIILEAPYIVDQQKVIGLIGNTGNATKEHLFLSVRKEGVFVNPFSLFNGVVDKKSPIIKDIVLRSGYYQKLLSPQSNSKVALPLRNAYDIFINAFDEPEAGRSRRQLKTLKVFISSANRVVFEKIIDFDTIVNNKLGGHKSVEEIYSKIWNENFIFAGSWEEKERRETYFIKVVAIDQGGNKTVSERTLYFR